MKFCWKSGNSSTASGEAGFVDGKLRVGDVPFALLGLQLRFDDVGMRGFSALFLFLRKILKGARIRKALLRVGELALRDRQTIVILHQRCEEAPRRQPGFGLRDCFGCLCAVILGAAGERQILVRLRIDVVDVRPVVGNKDSGESVIRLRVDELVHLLGLRQQSGFRLDAIFTGQERGDVGGLKIRTVLACALQRVGEADRERCPRKAPPGKLQAQSAAIAAVRKESRPRTE